MGDRSELDRKYFLDRHVYNCPFCNRRNVSYTVTTKRVFDWTEKKKCYVYFVICHSCSHTSMHLSYRDFELFGVGSGHYRFKEDEVKHINLDDYFFYSVPTSFFVLDKRIPNVLRELITEAEGCLKSNFLTGASACARKVVYELARIQEATGANYDDRIKSLKKLNPTIEPTFFDTLLAIQQVTSDKVHEESYDGWESKHLRLILATMSEILNEIFVVPATREDRRSAILKLREDVISKKKGKKNNGG